MNTKCVKIIVKGKVQGVFFRKFTKIAADDLEINGFVKNQYDGSVYIEACGDTTQLEKFIQWCKQGPEQAQVAESEVKEIEQKIFSSFRIVPF
ncbi:MAG: acylphosphatase [Bacteroidia bacterium]